MKLGGLWELDLGLNGINSTDYVRLNGLRAAQRTTCNCKGRSPELWLVVRDEEGDVRDGRFFGVSTRRLRLRKDAAVREREDEVEARNA